MQFHKLQMKPHAFLVVVHAGKGPVDLFLSGRNEIFRNCQKRRLRNWKVLVKNIFCDFSQKNICIFCTKTMLFLEKVCYTVFIVADISGKTEISVNENPVLARIFIVII